MFTNISQLRKQITNRSTRNLEEWHVLFFAESRFDTSCRSPPLRCYSVITLLPILSHPFLLLSFLLPAFLSFNHKTFFPPTHEPFILSIPRSGFEPAIVVKDPVPSEPAAAAHTFRGTDDPMPESRGWPRIQNQTELSVLETHPI
jgi:hypothetical protein